jgi:hypothetical protein
MQKFVIELSTLRVEDLRHDIRPYVEEVIRKVSHLFIAKPAAASKKLLGSTFALSYPPWADYPLFFADVDWRDAMETCGKRLLCVLKDCLLSMPTTQIHLLCENVCIYFSLNCSILKLVYTAST